jgi:hypothetical protein
MGEFIAQRVPGVTFRHGRTRRVEATAEALYALPTVGWNSPVSETA